MHRGLAALCLAIFAACSGGGKTPDTASGATWQGSLGRPRAGAVVVAEVDGDAIYDVEVARHAGQRGLTPAQALDELIDLQLLAQEAQRRGLADDPEVAELRRREGVRALLRTDFESAWTGADSVPQSDVDAAWRRRDIFYSFNHDKHHEVAFFRVTVARGKIEPQRFKETLVQARALRAAVVARAPHTKDEFHTAAREEAERLGITISAGSIATMQDGGGRVNPEFAALAFTIDEVGEMSEPGATQWGWDVLLLLRIIPDVHKTKEEAAPEIRQNLYDSSRRAGFLRYCDKLLAAHHVVTHDDRLEQVTVDAPTVEAP